MDYVLFVYFYYNYIFYNLFNTIIHNKKLINLFVQDILQKINNMKNNR